MSQYEHYGIILGTVTVLNLQPNKLFCYRKFDINNIVYVKSKFKLLWGIGS